MDSVLRHITTSENVLSKLQQPKHMQLHGVSESATSLPGQNLLERMSLGNQTLMIRLSLSGLAPVQLKPTLTQIPPSSPRKCSLISDTIVLSQIKCMFF